MNKQRDPIRILHIVGNLNRGGIETWLMHVLRNLDRNRFQIDFVVHTTKPGDYDEEASALGSQIIPCLHSEQPWLYARNFRKLWHQHGPYPIVHSHLHHYSGYLLRMTRQMGAPTRIAHSHNDTRKRDSCVGLMRKGYLALMKHLINQEATLGLACSHTAAASLYGSDWTTDSRWRVLYYGIDMQPFAEQVEREAVRSALGIPADAFVIGHVGRFMEQKNHSFLVEIAAEVVRRKPNTYLLLVGEGVLRPSIQQKVNQLGLAERTIFAGLRTDVPRLMYGAMDVFLLPSFYEGLPLVLLEAQAAGLPCVLNKVIAEETDVVAPLLYRHSLQEAASAWAQTVLDLCETKATVTPAQALALMQKSQFNIQNSVQQLEEIYCG